MSHPSINTRRDFVTQGLGVVGVSAALPNFLARTAMAGPQAQSDEPITVVVQLSGGNDGISSIVPYGDDAYNQNRKVTRIDAKKLHKINDYIGFSPELTLFKDMYDNGQLAIVQGIGYPNHNRSHFKSMDIWHTGNNNYKRTVGTKPIGWIGRYCEEKFANSFDPKAVMSIRMNKTPLAIQSESHPGLALRDPRAFRYSADHGQMQRKEAYRKLNNKMPDPKKLSPLDFVTQTSTNANAASDEILSIVAKNPSKASYPSSGLATSLKTVASMIAGGLSTRVYYVEQTGFDTHAGHNDRHQKLMTDLGAAITAFQKDLKAQGNDQRVVTMAFSEFGRRVKENGSGGLDHGQAGPLFVFGPNVKGGLYGKHPSMTDLDGGDLRFTTDFRGVYATLLDQWMGANSSSILDQQYDHLGFLA